MRGAGARTGTISGGGVATFGDVGEAEDEGEESEGEEGDVSLTRERDSVGDMREGGEGEGEMCVRGTGGRRGGGDGTGGEDGVRGDDARRVSFSSSRSRSRSHRVVEVDAVVVEVETSRVDAEAEGCEVSEGARNDHFLERVRVVEVDGGGSSFSLLSLSLTVLSRSLRSFDGPDIEMDSGGEDECECEVAAGPLAEAVVSGLVASRLDSLRKPTLLSSFRSPPLKRDVCEVDARSLVAAVATASFSLSLSSETRCLSRSRSRSRLRSTPTESTEVRCLPFCGGGGPGTEEDICTEVGEGAVARTAPCLCGCA